MYLTKLALSNIMYTLVNVIAMHYVQHPSILWVFCCWLMEAIQISSILDLCCFEYFFVDIDHGWTILLLNCDPEQIFRHYWAQFVSMGILQCTNTLLFLCVFSIPVLCINVSIQGKISTLNISSKRNRVRTFIW